MQDSMVNEQPETREAEPFRANVSTLWADSFHGSGSTICNHLSAIFEEAGSMVSELLERLTALYERNQLNHPVTQFHEVLMRLLTPFELKGIIGHSDGILARFKKRNIGELVVAQKDRKVRSLQAELLDSSAVRVEDSDLQELVKYNQIMDQEIGNRKENCLQQIQSSSQAMIEPILRNPSALNNIEQLKPPEKEIKTNLDLKIIKNSNQQPKTSDKEIETVKKEKDEQEIQEEFTKFSQSNRARYPRRQIKLNTKYFSSQFTTFKKNISKKRKPKQKINCQPKRQVKQKSEGMKQLNGQGKISSRGFEHIIFAWIVKAHSEGKKLNQKIIRQKSRQIGKSVNFKGSRHWFRLFKKRNPVINQMMEQPQSKKNIDIRDLVSSLNQQLKKAQQNLQILIEECPTSNLKLQNK